MDASPLTPLQKGITLVALILPAVSILIAQLVWKPTEEDAQCVRWRPASEVSLVAWVVIAMTSGLAWAMTNMQYFGGKMVSNVNFATLSTLFVVVFSLLIVHQSLYQQDPSEEDDTDMPKKEAMGIFVVLMLFLAPLVLMCYKCKPMCAALLAPLFFWIVYQMLLGAAELNCQVPVVCKDSITAEQETKLSENATLKTEKATLTTQVATLTADLKKLTDRGTGIVQAAGHILFEDGTMELATGQLVKLANTPAAGETQLFYILDDEGNEMKDANGVKITYDSLGVIVPASGTPPVPSGSIGQGFLEAGHVARALAVFDEQQNAMPDFGF